jgi:peptidoglycan/LPS O-acetylase OafA/YrhL
MTASGPAAAHGPGHAAYPALDGLRALAVFAVVTTHCAFATGRYERGGGSALLARLDVGVAIFFVLSGFLLVRPWLRAALRDGPAPSIRTYSIRRVARIMPAYLLAVAMALLLLEENAGATVWDWLRHLTLVQIYGPGWLREGLTQTWSLSTEVSFYVLLPVIGAAMMHVTRGRWRPGLLLGLLSLAALVPIPWYLFLDRTSADAFLSGGFWLPAFAGWFAGGMALAVVRVHLDRVVPPAASRWWAAEELGRHPFTCWALAAVAFAVAATPVAGPWSFDVPPGVGQAVTKQTLYLVVALALVWPAVFGRSPVTAAVFGNPVARYLGDISYGVFLYHLVVLAGVMNLLDYELWTGKLLQVLVLTLVGTGLIAAVSFRFIERPAIDWAHRVPTRTAAPTGPKAPSEPGRPPRRPAPRGPSPG